MLKKIAILGAAIAALVAFASPAAQASHVWKKNGVPIATDQVVTFTGSANFETTNTAFRFHTEITATIKTRAGTLVTGGSAGEVTEFHIKNCTGTGQLNGLPCTVTTTQVNWPVTFTANTTVTIGVNLHQLLYIDEAHTIPAATFTLAGPVILDLNTPAAIATATLTPGAGLLINGNEATASGTLTATEVGWSLGK
jgi:hypothetical protein